jgi:phosphate starvation-inducible PhoH-like protein
MKAFTLTPALLLFSSFGMNRGFYNPTISALFKGVSIDKSTLYRNQIHHIPETFQILDSKRRKGIEDFVVDGLIDSTKKLLSLEEELADKTNNKRRNIKSFQPKTENQRSFLELMREDAVDIIIAIGPAGTGKTMLACYAAVEALRLGKVNKIVVTRPVVSVDEEIGFLPGGLESKMDPWTRPIFDTLRESYSAKEIERMTEEGVIEIVPLGFMRGRTFKNAWIIADEMQNSSPTQMFMLATRIGEGSKMIITGDLNQSDLNPKCNGLLEIYNKVKQSERLHGLDCVKYIELDKEDVQRSRAAKVILDIYESPPIVIHNSTTSSLCQEDRCETSTLIQSDSDQNLHNFSFKTPISESSIRGEGVVMREECAADCASTSCAMRNCVQEPVKEPNIVSANDYPQPYPRSPSNVEWVNIDNDAALIPLRHIKRLN